MSLRLAYRLVAITALILGSSLTTACPDREVSAVEPNRVGTEGKALAQNRQLDLLFVIDNSDSMKEEQAALIANFDRFIAALQNIPGGLPDLHIGVVTSDLGTLDSGVNISGCRGKGDDGVMRTNQLALTNNARFLIDESDGTPTGRRRNYPNTLASAFATIANVGVGGCGLEQHLGAIERALITHGGAGGANAGFLRPEAVLAVVIIADEDDCSAAGPNFYGADASLGALDGLRCLRAGLRCGPQNTQAVGGIGEYSNCRPDPTSTFALQIEGLVGKLRALKKRPDDQLMIAGIIGPANNIVIENNPDTSLGQPALRVRPSCMYRKPMCTESATENCLQKAAPSNRIEAFANAFRYHFSTTICETDLAQSITALGQNLTAPLNPSCFTAPLRTPTDCVVTDIAEADGAREQLVPQCDATASTKPCWRIGTDTQVCTPPTFTGQRITFERTQPLPVNAVTRVECASEDSVGR